MSGAPLLAGFAVDCLLGDPCRWHPVAGFGRVAGRAEGLLYAPTRTRGAIYAVSLVLVSASLVELLARGLGPRGRALLLAGTTWAALGGRSLAREAAAVGGLVEQGDVAGARRVLPTLVGRDPEGLDGPDVCRAVVESVAENTSDAVVGALLWGAVAGPAGVVAYRSANTLDAMVGHRSERYREFGWAAARLDDAMSWPAARLTALVTAASASVVGGSGRRALEVARRDGRAHPSPNAGVAEGAFAGALGVRLGGTLAYEGFVEHRPALGTGPAPTPRDIRRAIRLSLAVGAATALLCAGLRSRLVRSAA